MKVQYKPQGGGKVRIPAILALRWGSPGSVTAESEVFMLKMKIYARVGEPSTYFKRLISKQKLKIIQRNINYLNQQNYELIFPT